jgi:hypothetical protein
MRPHVVSQAEGAPRLPVEGPGHPSTSSSSRARPLRPGRCSSMGTCRTLPSLSEVGRHASNAASEGCHSVAKLVMSDKQIAMSPSTFSKFVMLRHSKLAIAALKEMYKDEAQHVAHDITATSKLCALPLRLDRAVAADSESLDDGPLFPPRDPDEETQ